MEIIQIPAFQDNYLYLLISGGKVAAVDPGDAAPIIAELERRGLILDSIFITHHHRDHVGGNVELKKKYGCEIYGCAKDVARIPGITRRLEPGEAFAFGDEEVKVFASDGHTIGHISYWFEKSRALFCGDTIFSLGCGKLFEGSAEVMWASLAQLRKLPGDTKIYCAHEYTLENAAYALRVDPENSALQARVAEAEALRKGGNYTVPTLLATELLTNPFLRPESAELQSFVSKAGKPLAEVFGAIRECKDRFDSGEEI